MRTFLLSFFVLFLSLPSCVVLSQETVETKTTAQTKIPAVYSNIHEDEQGRLYVLYEGQRFYRNDTAPGYTLEKMQGNPTGTEKGIAFDFGDSKFEGRVIFGLIHYEDSKHPYPVYYASSQRIEGGKCEVNIKDKLSGRYDMTGWEKSGKGTIGYRVMNSIGRPCYDGIVSFIAGPVFAIDTTVIEGPFINLLTDEGTTISFKTNKKAICQVKVDGKVFADEESVFNHEIPVTGLKPNTRYEYSVKYGSNSQSYSFKTAPKQGSRTSFSFGYASDSRAGNGWGERTMIGVNKYIVKKIMALGYQQDIAFCQFTGDLISGYKRHREEMDLEYVNWKQSVAPFAHYFPVIGTIGNHEVLMHVFEKKGTRKRFRIDQFPFETHSTESVFAEHFVNPHNGPISEDNSPYDPNPNKVDFPSYDENVFYYIYDNLAMVVLNSDYFYAPSISGSPESSGNLHGYLMDNQMKWLENTIAMLEKNKDIDHIFVTQHTPAFPNGGHVGDDMWYRGNNKKRPYVAGEPVEKGIIERRDEYLDILINKSEKVVAILTGDEHNYCRTEIGPKTEIYPEGYPEENKLKLNRTIVQINNGAAGAPYYAQEITPWTPFTSGFTTQHALVIVKVDGASVKAQVLNPDTLEEIEALVLRK